MQAAREQLDERPNSSDSLAKNHSTSGKIKTKKKKLSRSQQVAKLRKECHAIKR